MLFEIVGDEPFIRIPPPSPNPNVLNVDRPFWIVKPFRTDDKPSPETNATTDSALFPSMIVDAGPLALVTVIALPWKFRFSLYVPAATRTVSPLTAASIAD